MVRWDNPKKLLHAQKILRLSLPYLVGLSVTISDIGDQPHEHGVFCFCLFLPFWGWNLGPGMCRASALPLSYTSSPQQVVWLEDGHTVMQSSSEFVWLLGKMYFLCLKLLDAKIM